MEKVLLEHCFSGSLNNLESLLKRGISPNIALNTSRQTVFVVVCKIYNCLLLRKDFSILGELRKYIDTWKGNDVKKLQLKFHLEKVIKQLVQYGGSPDFCDISGNNALHLCAEARMLDILKDFFQKGINPNLVDVNKNSVLHLALNSYNGDPYALTEYVINKGLDVNILNNSGLSALHIASQYCHFKSAVVLLEKGANVNVKTFSGDTPLILACVKKPESAVYEQGRNQVKGLVATLIKHGACIDTCNNSGRTALHHAAISWQSQVLQLLIQEGANVNLTDVKQKSPLHFYLEQGKLSIRYYSKGIGVTKTVEAFLYAGAEIVANDISGQTPLCCMFLPAVVDFQTFSAVIKLFLQAGLSINTVPKQLQIKLQTFVLDTNDWSFIHKTIVLYGWKFPKERLLECKPRLLRENNSSGCRVWNVEDILTLQNEIRTLSLLTADRIRQVLHKNAIFAVKKLQLPAILENIICPK